MQSSPSLTLYDLPAPLKWLGRFAVRGASQAIFDGWLKPKILGRGNIPANRNFIVVANHSSHLDFSLVGYALGAVGDDIRVLAAKDYFFNTPARRFLASNFTSLMPFDRERAQLESLEDALAELAQGRSVLMFPEGTRSADGEIHEFKSGAGFLALRSRCDVLPVLIRGTHDVMGKGSLFRGAIRWKSASVARSPHRSFANWRKVRKAPAHIAKSRT